MSYVFCITISNLQNILSPFTHKIYGKVIDSKTRKPLTNIVIKVGWAVESSNIGGNSFNYYRIYSTKTNKSGEFIIPMTMKALSVKGVIFDRRFYGVNLAAYSLKYDYQFHKEKLTDSDRLEIAMHPIETDKSFAENIINFWEGLRIMTTENKYHLVDMAERNYLKQAYYAFEKKYPDSNEDKQYLEEYFHIYSLLKEPETVYLLNVMLKKFMPDTREHKFAKDNISIFKKTYNIN
jgi:hypothetical protein